MKRSKEACARRSRSSLHLQFRFRAVTRVAIFLFFVVAGGAIRYRFAWAGAAAATAAATTAAVAIATSAKSVSVVFTVPGSAQKPLGTMIIRQSRDGLTFDPRFSGLLPGSHGLYVREKGSCEAAAQCSGAVQAASADGHCAPTSNGVSKGQAVGEKVRELPNLVAGSDGKATTKMRMTGLKLADIDGRSLFIDLEINGNTKLLPEKEVKGTACGVVSVRR